VKSYDEKVEAVLLGVSRQCRSRIGMLDHDLVEHYPRLEA
jgi:hypothetical protein